MELTKEQLYKRKDQIMETFDFKKVMDYMQSVDWKWSNLDEYRVPDEFDLRGTAASLLTKAIEDDTPSLNIGTGGFYVFKFPWGLQLVFALTTRTSF
jgi:hypothetical protein